MLSPILSALIVSGGIGSLLLWVVGVVIAFAIVVFIMRQLAAPPVAYTVLYVVGAIVLLLIVIDAFFGTGPVVLR